MRVNKMVKELLNIQEKELYFEGLMCEAATKGTNVMQITHHKRLNRKRISKIDPLVSMTSPGLYYDDNSHPLERKLVRHPKTIVKPSVSSGPNVTKRNSLFQD